MRLRTWLLLLFGSLLIVTGLALGQVASEQARVNLLRSVERQLDKGARATYESRLLGTLRVLGYSIEDSPTWHEYRALFITLNGPYQSLVKASDQRTVLAELGKAQPDDGKAWTAGDFNLKSKGRDADYNACWQALQGLMRDVGVTVFEESYGNLHLLILTDKLGVPFLELKTAPDGKNPTAEDEWHPPEVGPELAEVLKRNLTQAQEGYIRHLDGQVYLVRVQQFKSGGQLVLGHRMDRRFEVNLEQQVPGAEFRVSEATSAEEVFKQGEPLRDTPYLNHAEPLFWLGSTEKRVAHIWEFRSHNSVEAYLHSLTQGIATLGFGAMGLGLLGIYLATQSITVQIGRLSARMKEVGSGQLGDDLPPAGPLEVREATASFNQMIHQLRQKEMLAKMVPKQAREAIEQEKTKGGRVVARRIRTTILFSDIRGFTNLSERLSPQEVMKLLDIYLSKMTTVIEEHGGDVNEYIGDAILADFEDRPEAPGALRAVRASWQMRLALDELREQGLHPELATLRQGLGLHTGELVKGEVGAAHRSKFALIGDTVNLAARIQDRSRDGKHTGILLSDDSKQDLSGFEVVLFGDESFKGKSGLIRVWEVVRPDVAPERDSKGVAGTAPTEPG